MTVLRQLLGGARNKAFDTARENQDVAAGDSTSAEDGVLHQRGLDRLQAGEWAPAAECFSELVDRYPDHDYYAQLLEQACLREELDDRPPRRQTGRSLLRSKAIWVLTVLNLVLWGATLGRQLYQQHIMPALQQRQAYARQQELLDEGRQFVAAGELDQAAERFSQVLDIDADNATAQRGLDEINRRQELAQSYDAALADMEQGRWTSALEALESIRQQEPGFRDVQQQLEQVRELGQWGGAFEEAQRLLQAGEWQAAIDQVKLLEREAPGFRPDAVKELHSRIYVRQAEAALSDLGEMSFDNQIAQLEEAVALYNQALEVDPSLEAATTQRELAREYTAGLEAYQGESWEAAGFHLASVYTVAPEYAGGRAVSLLQTAYVQSGSRYARSAKYGRAAERYRQAIALGLVNGAQSLADEGEERLRAADDLVREDRYREATTIYAGILDAMGLGEETVALDKPAPAPPEPASPPSGTTYVVKPNDTLSEIAQRFDATVAAILEANDIIWDRSLIRPGWQLVISQP